MLITRRIGTVSYTHLNLVIEDGEFMTLLGPSGCGKTTTRRVVAGLEKPQEGYMYMGDREIVNAPEKFYEEPGKRHLNLVFQSYALWPHMTCLLYTSGNHPHRYHRGIPAHLLQGVGQ